MAAVRGKDTKPEMLIRRYLHGQGFRYRLHDKSLPGSPDLVLPKYKTVVFVHGCFWHQHGKSCGVKSGPPSINLAFWEPKLQRNTERDQAAQNALKAQGWQVLLVWECELNRTRRGATLHRLSGAIIDAVGLDAMEFNLAA
ncbi:very short patch repair endonuclease (plasmid) [Hymenobacter sp. 5516J-16]|uniref:very short patch repair endonuclease n=1 Tax=Hymenobacter sp. 5516J-16 TaxID=2932253 RepID=UPI001FD4489C|nr:very short patch repair endonuclease [Hymenobacter sp. 5516J-16]UOQ79249.1 very short patch repair endonuclease [Hymenobacter sp. 5516J-16]